jgi:hypothetical protein
MAMIDTAEIGRRGGKARVKAQTPQQRSDSARNASLARWAKERKKKGGKKRAKNRR